MEAIADYRFWMAIVIMIGTEHGYSESSGAAAESDDCSGLVPSTAIITIPIIHLKMLNIEKQLTYDNLIAQ